MWASTRKVSMLLIQSCQRKFPNASVLNKVINNSKYDYFKFLSTSSHLSCSVDKTTNNLEEEKKYHSFVKKLRKNYEKLQLTAPKRTAQLSSVVGELEKTERALKYIEQTREILHDAASEEELQDLATVELLEARQSFNDAFSELASALLALKHTIPTVGREVVLELSAGVGGAEAMLFCQELWNMYQQFALRNGWQFVQQEYAESDLDGLRRGQALICPGRSEDAYSLLQHEAGIHRVQRVPKTERSGRIHTSTVAVVVMLQPTEFDIQILAKDLKVEAFRSKGAGGQSVNTADSAVRITHLPTGTVVECQQERAQHKNRALAMARLRSILYQREKDKEIETTSANRKLQLGTKGRSEKIRTYNFSQDRVTDHRIGLNLHKLNGILSGDEALQQLLMELRRVAEKESLQVLLDSEPLAHISSSPPKK